MVFIQRFMMRFLVFILSMFVLSSARENTKLFTSCFGYSYDETDKIVKNKAKENNKFKNLNYENFRDLSLNELNNKFSSTNYKNSYFINEKFNKTNLKVVIALMSC